MNSVPVLERKVDPDSPLEGELGSLVMDGALWSRSLELHKLKENSSSPLSCL